jgi:Phosphoesterase family
VGLLTTPVDLILISAANDGHDTSVTTAALWARSFLTPLLSNSNFMNKTLILLSKSPGFLNRSWTNNTAFDESETYTNTNQVFSVLLGDAVPASSQGTTDGTAYNHYSQLATVENNWSLGNLGLNDASASPFF